ncbi:MAG: hypothetical protein OQK75_08830 [Gammaproteobacteria bacterium]|nr:hypothetical protein [Gammaproteobacteria bacterium]
MLEAYMRLSFILFSIMAASVIVGLMPLLFIQTFIYKKIFDATYFNNNHFSLNEIAMFNSFPLYFIKTLAYVRAIVFPKTMRKRFKNNILNIKDHPFIYSLAFLTILILIYGAIVIINFFIVGGLMYFNGLL